MDRLRRSARDLNAIRPGADRWTNVLLSCGALGGLLFVAVFIAEGATRKGYDPFRQPVSSLALGERGWTQRANFIGTGLLMLACAEGLRRAWNASPGRSTWGPRLVGLYAIGLIGAGVFVTDPVEGYPDATPTPGEPSVHGMLHTLFSMQVFAALSAACVVYARRFAESDQRAWSVYSAGTGALVPAGILLFGHALAREDGLGKVAGLIQRLTIAIGWSWLTSLALRVRHSARWLRPH